MPEETILIDRQLTPQSKASASPLLTRQHSGGGNKQVHANLVSQLTCRIRVDGVQSPTPRRPGAEPNLDEAEPVL